MIALLEAYQIGLFKFRHWLPNIGAGIIVGIVALPLAMAFAIASGVKPEQGIYTAIISGFVVGIFGGSRVQIAGPTGAFIVILANITAQYGIDGLQLATLLAGFILLFMGAIRLGNVIKFIPDPVIVGFTSGIAVIIFVSEWKDFFGLSLANIHYSHFHEKLLALFQAFPSTHWITLGLALSTLILMGLTPKLPLIKKIPGPLFALIIVTIVQSLYQFEGVATIGSTFGDIPQRLPHFQFPHFSLSHVLELIGPAFTIALLCAIESLLCAVVADGMLNTRHNANQELIGQGLANIACPLFGGFAATGAIARTATNIRQGGNSPLSAIVHSLVLVLILLLLAPLATHIPLCVLAAILFVVAYNMSDAHHFFHILKHAPRNDIVVLITTFILTVFVDLVVAVNVGVILAVLLFARNMGRSVTMQLEDKNTLSLELNGFSIPPDILVYNISGPFFFGAIETLERALANTHTDPKAIIFRLKNVPFMDVTGLQTFYELLEAFYKRGVIVYLCEANTRVTHKLEKMHLLQWIHNKQIYSKLSDILLQVTPDAA